MSNKSKEMIVHLPPLKMILLYGGMLVVFEAIFFLSITLGNLAATGQIGIPFMIYTPFLLILSIVLCVLTLKKTYYIINDKEIVHVRMGSETSYTWKHIIYVDEEWSKKHKTLLFYLEDGKERFLSFDKDHLVYDYALEYGSLISSEEFRRRYQKSKL